MPTGAVIYMVSTDVRAVEVMFVDTTNNTGMLAVHAGSSSIFQGIDSSFVGWIGSNVVSSELCRQPNQHSVYIYFNSVQYLCEQCWLYEWCCPTWRCSDVEAVAFFLEKIKPAPVLAVSFVAVYTVWMYSSSWLNFRGGGGGLLVVLIA